MAKKDCMVQVCLRKPGLFSDWGDIDIVEDTDLITYKKAVELYVEWRPKLIAQLKQGADVEMGIWINCKDNSDYHTFTGHIDYSCEVDGDRVYRIKRELIELPAPKEDSK